MRICITVKLNVYSSALEHRPLYSKCRVCNCCWICIKLHLNMYQVVIEYVSSCNWNVYLIDIEYVSSCTKLSFNMHATAVSYVSKCICVSRVQAKINMHVHCSNSYGHMRTTGIDKHEFNLCMTWSDDHQSIRPISLIILMLYRSNSSCIAFNFMSSSILVHSLD